MLLLTSFSITVNWKDKHGNITSTPAKVGMNLLTVAHREGIELEGMLEGSLFNAVT
jgi:hypothetical protein